MGEMDRPRIFGWVDVIVATGGSLTSGQSFTGFMDKIRDGASFTDLPDFATESVPENPTKEDGGSPTLIMGGWKRCGVKGRVCRLGQHSHVVSFLHDR